MAGSRISLVLHDGNRITDRKPLAKAFHDKTAMEITRAFYGPAVETKTYDSNDLKGELVVGIGNLKQDDKAQVGLQLYVAVEVDGKVVEMGLPFVPGSQGEAFLNPANIRPGDIDALLKNMPSNTEILLVWRLDRGMTQDIVLSKDSVVSSMAPSVGNDYSLLDNKPCVGCGMGPGSKIDLVADISEIRLFCGDRNNPISMGTLLVAPPESFSFDSWSPQAPVPSPLVQVQQPSSAFRPDSVLGPSQVPIFMHADFVVRFSWEDSLRPSETVPPLLLQSGFYPDAALRQEPAPVAINQNPKPVSAALVFAICSSKEPVCQAETPVIPAQSQPNERLITLIMNPAELRLWSEIYKRPVQNESAQPDQSLPLMAAPIQKTTTRPFAIPVHSQPAINRQSASSQFACGFHQPRPETILKTVTPAHPEDYAIPPLKIRQPVLVLRLKKRELQPRTVSPANPAHLEQKKPGRKSRNQLAAAMLEAIKKITAELHATRKPPQKEAKQKTPEAPKAEASKKPKQAPTNKKQTPEEKVQVPATKAKTQNTITNPSPRSKSAPALSPAAKPVLSPTVKNTSTARKPCNRAAKKKDIPFYLINELLAPQWKSRGRKFRMKKNRAV